MSKASEKQFEKAIRLTIQKYPEAAPIILKDTQGILPESIYNNLTNS